MTTNSPAALAARARFSTAAIFLALVSTASFALVDGGTNLPAPGYPGHKCSTPMPRPDKPFRNDEYSTRSYTAEVERYNRQVKEFRDCMADYVDNANNDIKRIQESAQKALDEFRAVTAPAP